MICHLSYLNKGSSPCSRVFPSFLASLFSFGLFAFFSEDGTTAEKRREGTGRRIFPQATEKNHLFSVQGWAALLTFDTAPGCSLPPVSGPLWCLSSFLFFPPFQQGSLYQSHQSYMTFLLGSLIKRPRKPAYTEALNWVNYKPPSTFATVGRITHECGRLAAGFSPDAVIFHHLFLMRRVGGMQKGWIFMNLQKAYMYRSDFHPCHQAMQIASSRLRVADAALINGTVKRFSSCQQIELLQEGTASRHQLLWTPSQRGLLTKTLLDVIGNILLLGKKTLFQT